jgi:pyrimidine-specific ribonucleoside hydrolase
MLKRRQFIVKGVGALAALSTPAISLSQLIRGGTEVRPIPLVHITDLYHPPQDPDDHIDLATVVALREFDLRGVVLDTTQKFLDAAPAGFDIPRDPGFVPVAQLGSLLGRSLPVAAGPLHPLAMPADDAADRPAAEQGGITLLLSILKESTEPVIISAVGSARVITAAFNRDPVLVRAKTRRILLNAGSTAGSKREWNVGLDPAAYIGLWNSGLPIDWYPCATERGAFNPDHERGTYWKSTHAALFRYLKSPVRAWFRFAFTGDKRGDIIRALGEEGDGTVWDAVLAESRSLWATASLVMAAERVLARTGDGWRFLPASACGGADIWSWHLDPIIASVNPDAVVTWELAEHGSHVRLFRRQRGADFGAAMAEALGALLGDIP